MPQFTKEVKNLTVPANECAIFEARYDPKTAEVNWFREDVQINDGIDFRIFSKNGMSMLTVGTAFPEDSGVFTCQVSANGESILSSGQLTVTGGNPNTVTTGQKVPSEIFKQKPQSVITINGGQKITVDREQADAMRKAQGKSGGIVMGGSMMDSVLGPKKHQPQQNVNEFQPQQFKPQQNVQSFKPQNLPSQSHNKPPPVQAPKPTNFKPVKFQPGNNGQQPPKPVSKPSFTAPLKFDPSSFQNPEIPNLSISQPTFAEKNLTGTQPPPVTTHSSVKPAAPKQVFQSAKNDKPIICIAKPPLPTLNLNLEPVRPEPISVNDAETEKLSNIQTHLSSQPPVFEDAADAEFDECDDTELAEPQIHESLYHMKLPLESALNLQILSSGCPIPKCFWFKEGRQISKRSKHFMISTKPGINGDVTFNLQVPKTCPQDDGIYSCVVISPAGLAISTARIKLFKPENGVSSSNQAGMAPVIKPDDQVINQIQSLSLNPAPVSSANISGLASSSNMSNTKTNDSMQTANYEAEIEEEEDEYEEEGEEGMDFDENEVAEELTVEAFEMDKTEANGHRLPEGVPEFQPSKYSYNNLEENNTSNHTYNPGQTTLPQTITYSPKQQPQIPSNHPVAQPKPPRAQNYSTSRQYESQDNHQTQSRSNSRLSSRPNSPFRGINNSRPASRGGFLPQELLDEEERKVTRMPQHVRGTVEADEEPEQKYYKPHFLQMPPAEVVVQEGKFFRLDAKVTGLPIPQISFLRNGQPVRPDRNHRLVVRENNVHSLLVEQAIPKYDAGEYVVQARNIAGVQQMLVKVTVIEKQEDKRPVFVKRMQGPLRINLGDTFELEIQTQGFPKPMVGWKRGSDGVVPNGRIQLDVDDNTGTQKLTVTDAQRYDAGWYTCCSVNKCGIASCTAKVEIIEEWEKSEENPRVRSPSKVPRSPRGSSRLQVNAHVQSAHYDEEDGGLQVQKSSRLAKMDPAMREALRVAYSQDAQGTQHAQGNPQWNDEQNDVYDDL